MSELTSYNSERIYWAVEQVEREAGDIDDIHLDDNLFYLKSEADKVIADLEADYKEACDRLQTANLIKDEQLAATRHQKYKRCLAMADFCSYKAWYYKYNGKEEIFYRWMKYRRVWAKLAKKFKEAK